MRRTTAILTVCLCAAAGCRGGVAQEPYDGMLAARRPTASAPIPARQAPDSEPIASEVDVPWVIALLSDAKTSATTQADTAIVVDSEPDPPETIVEETDLNVAIDPTSLEEKPATRKVCSGVVKTRS